MGALPFSSSRHSGLITRSPLNDQEGGAPALLHPFPSCRCRLCGSFVVDGAADTGPSSPSTDDVARLLSDVGTLGKLDTQLFRRVDEMLREFSAGRR